MNSQKLGGLTKTSHARQFSSQFYYINTGQDYIKRRGIVYEYDFTLDSLSILKILKLDKVRGRSELLIRASGFHCNCVSLTHFLLKLVYILSSI